MKRKIMALITAAVLALMMFPAFADAAAPSAANEYELSVSLTESIEKNVMGYEFSSATPLTGRLSVINEYVTALYPGLVQLTMFNPSSGNYRIVIELIDGGNQALARGEAVKVVNSVIKKDMNAAEKITAIHDYMTAHCRLDVGDAQNMAQMTAYGVLVNKRGTPRGFAEAFSLMCSVAGVPCVLVTGLSGDGQAKGAHYWNLVYDGSSWKHVDSVYDLTSGPAGYRGSTYLLVEDSVFPKGREWNKAAYSALVEYAYPMYEQTAKKLDAMGLFAGTESGYELTAKPTRAQCAVMLVRLLGKESAVRFASQFYTDVQPFADVPSWAAPYVGYLWENKLTNGVDASGNYGSARQAAMNDYLTFMLRLLGYSDPSDFTWANARDTAVRIGILTDARADIIAAKGFTRGDLVLISYNALKCEFKGGRGRLIDSLLESGAVGLTAARSAGLV